MTVKGYQILKEGILRNNPFFVSAIWSNPRKGMPHNEVIKECKIMQKLTEYTLGKTVISSEYDSDADTSYYGTYGNAYTPGCIIRADETFYEDHIEDIDKEDDDGYPLYEVPTIRGEYSFFYPSDTGENIGTELYRKYSRENYKRLEEFNNSQWGYIGITVKTTVHIDGVLSDTISDALWGIETDSSDEHFKSEIEELKESVKDQLRKMGFSDNEINASVDNAETKKGECYL